MVVAISLSLIRGQACCVAFGKTQSVTKMRIGRGSRVVTLLVTVPSWTMTGTSGC